MMTSAALASPQTSPFMIQSKSFNIDRNPNPSAAAFRAAYGSDFPELNAIMDCVLAQPLMVCCPIFIQTPVVDVLLSLQPAQSASLNTFNTDGPVCHLDTCCNLGLW